MCARIDEWASQPPAGCFCKGVPVVCLGSWTWLIIYGHFLVTPVLFVLGGHIWSCSSLQNRPPAVQGSPQNGQPPPCMNPALMNAPWVRERRRGVVFFHPIQIAYSIILVTNHSIYWHDMWQVMIHFSVFTIHVVRSYKISSCWCAVMHFSWYWVTTRFRAIVDPHEHLFFVCLFFLTYIFNHCITGLFYQYYRHNINPLPSPITTTLY